MKHTEAAEIYLREQPFFDGLDARAKELDQAKKTLKAYMTEKKKTTYRGITLTETTSRRLDSALARAALGPKKVEQCTVETVRQQLQLPPALRHVPVDTATNPVAAAGL